MGTDTAENWDDFFVQTPVVPFRNEARADSEPGPSTSARIPLAARHVVEMENWDDDFADDDACSDGHANANDSADADVDVYPEEEFEAVGPSTLSVGVRVVATRQGDFGEEDGDSDEESWDEEDEELEESRDDQQKEEERDCVPPAPTILAGVDAAASPSASSSSSSPKAPGDETPSSSSASEPSHRSLPVPHHPPFELLVPSIPSSAFAPASSPPSVSLSAVSSTPAPTFPPTRDEFGSKTPHDDRDEGVEIEDEDEDATITARSRRSRRGRRVGGHTRGHSGSARPLPVPPVPATSSIPVISSTPSVQSVPTFTPRPPSSSSPSSSTSATTNTAPPLFTPPPLSPPTSTVFPPAVDVDVDVDVEVEVADDRGEGPSRRAPVFSPPGAAVMEHRNRQPARPRTADGLGLGLHSQSQSRLQEGQGGRGSGRTVPARASLDAYRSLSELDAYPYAGGSEGRSVVTGSGDRGERGERGFLSRLGQGVARWASTSKSNANSNSSSSSTSRADLSNTEKRRERGRGRSATVTGATSAAAAPASVVNAPLDPRAQAQAQTQAQTQGSARPALVGRRPSVSVSMSGRPLALASGSGSKAALDAVPRSALSSAAARPSTSSSARPSTSSTRPSTSTSTASSSGQPSSRPIPRPTPRTTNPAPPAQRTSIVSLLSIYTHRSRASSVSISGSGSRRTSVVDNVEDGGEEAAPRTSIGSWTRGLFSSSGGGSGGGGESRSMSAQDEHPASNARQRQSLDMRPRSRRGVVDAPAASSSSSSTAAAAVIVLGRGGAGGGQETETKGVLGFFGRRRRSNTVTATTAPASSSSSSAVKDDAEEVYANKKASRSQRSLLLLGRRPSVLVRRASQKGAGVGGQVAKEKAKEVARDDMTREAEKRVEAEAVAPPVAPLVFSPPPPPLAVAPGEHVDERPVPGPGLVPEPEPAVPLAPRGMKRRIPSGRGSLPLALAPPARAESEPVIGTRMDMDTHQNGTARPPQKHTHTQSQSSSHSTSHSTSTSLSSIGELRIPSRISQAQVSIRRDLGLVKEFAGKVAELKDLQGSYLQMIESVQGMIDSDNGQVLLLPTRTSRPRSNTSPALSRPPSRSPLASLFQGPNKSLNATTSDSASPGAITPITPSTPSGPLYNSTDLAQRMADITARYDSWWECAELLIELGNTPPSMPTPVSTVRLVPPTSVIAATPPPSPAPTPPTPVASVTSKSRGDNYGALAPASSIPVSSTSNHTESTLKPSRGRANTFAGNMPVARLRSASTSTASISYDVPNHMLSPSASSASSAPSHTWRATTGRHDLSQRQLVLLRQMLGVDQKPRPSAAAPGPVMIPDNEDDDGLDGSDGESDVEDATWRWGHANTVQLPSPAEEQEAYFGIAGRKKEHNRPWSRPYHNDIAQSEYEDQGLAVYVTPAPDPSETKKSKGMNAIRDMLRTLKRAHPPTPTSSTFPISVEAPPSLAPAPKTSVQFSQTAANGANSLAPNRHAIRKAASLLPLSATAPSARIPSSSSTVSRASKIDPTLAFAMTPNNIKPLLDNAREVRARLGACVADVQALLASAGVDSVVAD